MFPGSTTRWGGFGTSAAGAGAAPDLGRDGAGRAVAVDGDVDRVARLPVGDGGGHIVGAAHVLPADGGDHVALGEPGLIGPRAGSDAGHDGALADVEAELALDSRRERDGRHAEEGLLRRLAG